jgi:hypothetical protein
MQGCTVLSQVLVLYSVISIKNRKLQQGKSKKGLFAPKKSKSEWQPLRPEVL